MHTRWMSPSIPSTGLDAVTDTITEEVEHTSTVFSDIFEPILDILPSLGFALVFLLIGYFLVRKALKILKKALAKSSLDHIVVSFINSVVKILLYVLLIVIFLSMLDVPMDSITAVIASAGVAVGLALQDSLSNVAGGFIVLFSKPLKQGDTVEVDGTTGVVDSITVLYTCVVTCDNKTVYIPNGTMATAKITNFTEKETRRVDLSFGVGYHNDLAHVRRVMLSVVAAEEQALHEPAPEVVVTEDGEYTITLELHVWTKTEDYWPLYYALLEDVPTAFAREGITIPRQQVDVAPTTSPATEKKI